MTETPEGPNLEVLRSNKNTSHEIAISQPLAPEDLLQQVQLIQRIMAEVMIDGEHYGIIPGTGDKKTLLKSGAEKLCMTFRLHPQFIIERHLLNNGHREYEITCRLLTDNGSFVSEGVGICSSMESKYRWRNQLLQCPKCSQELRKSRNDDGFYCWAKTGGCGSQFAKGDPIIIDQPRGRIENPDLADTFNTVKKMAKKRAHVDATITATAASDLFSQDLEAGEPASPIKQRLEPVSQNIQTVTTKKTDSSLPMPNPGTDLDFPLTEILLARTDENEPPLPTEEYEPITEEDAKENWPTGNEQASQIPPKPSNADSPPFFFVFFTAKPPDALRQGIRTAGFRFDGERYCWYAPDSIPTRMFYDKLLKAKDPIVDWRQTHSADQGSPATTQSEPQAIPLSKTAPPDPDPMWTQMKSPAKIDFLQACAHYKEKIGPELYYQNLHFFDVKKSSHLHPDDKPTMDAILAKLMQEQKLVEAGVI